jgi:hypothetical protein
MPTSTSLNLQALLKTASARTGMDQAAQRVRGLSPSAQALYVAIQAGHRRNALTVVVVPTDEDLDRFAADVRFFIGALEGASGAELDDRVKPFPSLQIDPYRKLAPHFHIASARAAALHGLASGSARVVVASGAALLPKLSHPDRLRSASIELKPGDGSGTDRAGRSSGGCRLHTRGSRRRARRVLRARRHRGLVSGGRRQPDPRGVHRRQHRIDPPLRSGHSAIHRHARSGGGDPAHGKRVRG